jgi:hypothetical protein
MNRVKTILLLVMVLTAVTAAAASDDDVGSATGVINSYSHNAITRDAVKTELASKYAAGTLTKADLKTAVTSAYNHNKLKRDDMRWLLGEMYKEGKLTRADLRWVLTEAYKKGELTRDDVRFIIAQAYRNGELTREDVKFLIMEAYKAGELNREDMAWLITHAYKKGEFTREDVRWIVAQAYKTRELTRDDVRLIIIVSYNHGELTRADVKWFLMQAYRNNELTREDIRILITAAYRHGELTRADVTWLIVQAYRSGELTRGDMRWILIEAIKRGELRKADVLWLINEAYKAKELTTSDITEEEVNSTPVEVEPPDVPSVEEITEPNADSASSATSANSFDEDKAPTSAESLIKTKQAWMLYKYALVPIEKHRIGMEAIIGYVQSTGKDTSKLVTLKEQFLSQADQLKEAAEKNDYQSARSIISQMKDTVTDFRTETKTLLAGNESAAKEALDAAILQNRDYFDSLVTEARKARKDRNLEFFDLSVARAQGRLDRAKDRGVDVSLLQAKLDEIKDLRSTLVDAMNGGIAACDGEGIGKCTRTDAASYLAVREEIKDKYKELVELAKTAGQAQRFQVAITGARRIIVPAEKFLDTVSNRGIDVSAEKTKLSGIKDLVDSAESKYKSGDYTGAKEYLRKAQEEFRNLRTDAAARRRAK